MAIDTGFIMVPRWLLKRGDVTSAAKLVYGCLRAHEMGQLGSCTATSDKIAHETGVNARTVKRALAQLEELKLIERKSDANKKFVTTTEWKCLF